MGLLTKAAAVGALSGKADSALLEFLREYHRRNPSFQGIVLDAPQNGGRDFCDHVAAMTGSFAVVRGLPSGRCLILFSQSQDRELIGHRLSKTLNTPAPCAFEAEDPQSALALIEPYQ